MRLCTAIVFEFLAPVGSDLNWIMRGRPGCNLVELLMTMT